MIDWVKKIEEIQKKNIEENGQILSSLHIDTVRKLLDESLLDLNYDELCFVADISKSTLFEWFKKIPELKETIELNRGNLKHKAKRVVKEAIESGDKDTSKWYLEKRAGNEFNSKIINENTNTNKNLELDEEEKKKILENL